MCFEKSYFHTPTHSSVHGDFYFSEILPPAFCLSLWYALGVTDFSVTSSNVVFHTSIQDTEKGSEDYYFVSPPLNYSFLFICLISSSREDLIRIVNVTMRKREREKVREKGRRTERKGEGQREREKDR